MQGPSFCCSCVPHAWGAACPQGDETGSDNEVQRTMLQIVTELDGFDPRGNIKVRESTGNTRMRGRQSRRASTLTAVMLLLLLFVVCVLACRC